VTIIIGSIMATASAVSGDNLQDLKAGQWVGATPWKQQVMLMLGVVVGALAITPILQILFEAYGIGDVLPRTGMDPTKTLTAPKAAVMAAIAGGVFEQTLDWSLFGIGAVIAAAVIIIDEIFILRNTPWRLPILAVAVGIYMPLDVTVPVFIGGLISYFADVRLRRNKGALGTQYEKVVNQGRHRGMLFSSGLIAGEALVGVALAIPFAAYQNTNLFRIMPASYEKMSMLMGALAFMSIGFYLYRIGSATKTRS
jgi:putative OPT family oligopeptide transporter